MNVASTSLARTDFFDPVHGFISVDQLLDSTGGQDWSGLFGEVISAFEFCRQSYVRQSSFSFLRYPSATHTRFAHSVGAFSIGPVAGDAFRVLLRDGQAVTLKDYFKRHEVWHEFLLAILLHDVGHFCFSHTLESNFKLWERFKCFTNEHESVGCELIRGNALNGESSHFADALRNRRDASGLDGEILLLKEALSPLSSESLNTIYYWITGDQQYVEDGLSCGIDEANMGLELVSGLLDLDRLDHYPRDAVSFFGREMGTEVDVQCLLDGLVFERRSPRPFQVRTAAAAGQVIRLLQLRERLNRDCFCAEETLSSEAMFNEAFATYVSDNALNPESLADLLMRTDDEVLGILSRSDNPTVRYLIGRVACRRPYRMVARLPFILSDAEPLEASEIERWLRDYLDVGDHRLALRFSKAFSRSRAPRNDKTWAELDSSWLALERLVFDFPEKEMYALPINYFRAQQHRDVANVWVFSNESFSDAQIRNLPEAVHERWPDNAAFGVENLPL